MPAFITSYSILQAGDCSSFSITDTSNYTAEGKGTFSARNLWIFNSQGQTFDSNGFLTATPTAIDFSFGSYPDDTITIPVLTDYGLTIRLQLVSTNPQAGSVYELREIISLLCYLKTFEYGLLQDTAAQQMLLNNQDFYNNLSALQTEIDNAETATAYSDVNAVQQAIDRANQLMLNQLKAF